MIANACACVLRSQGKPAASVLSTGPDVQLTHWKQVRPRVSRASRTHHGSGHCRDAAQSNADSPWHPLPTPPHLRISFSLMSPLTSTRGSRSRVRRAAGHRCPSSAAPLARNDAHRPRLSLGTLTLMRNPIHRRHLRAHFDIDIGGQKVVCLVAVWGRRALFALSHCASSLHAGGVAPRSTSSTFSGVRCPAARGCRKFSVDCGSSRRPSRLPCHSPG